MEGPARELREKVIGSTLAGVDHDPQTGWMTLLFERDGVTVAWDVVLDMARPIQEVRGG